MQLKSEHCVLAAMVREVVFSYKEEVQMKQELSRLRSDLWKLRTVIEKTFVPRRSYRSFRLKFLTCNSFSDDMRKLRLTSFKEARPFEGLSFLKEVV